MPEFMINDTAAVKGRKLLWQMGNGDAINDESSMKYSYASPGKYLVTLKIDNSYTINKYIKVISGTEPELQGKTYLTICRMQREILQSEKTEAT